jgi:Flp pilus assembly protein TadG
MARFIISSWFSIPRTHGHRNSEAEAGQVLMLFALLIPVLLGMAALAIDLGSFAAHRRTLQNSADAIALAAAQELPDQAAAQQAALDWADRYDIDAAELTIVTSPATASQPNPSVRVTIDREHQFHFMAALQVDDAPVSASAKAVKTSPSALQGQVVPWAVLESTRDESEPGDTVTLKYDSQDSTTGNFAAMRLDGNGASIYGDSIEQGSSSIVCSDDATACAETSPVCEGAVCQTETGNMVGSTRSGVDYRIDNTDAQCSVFEDVFTQQSDGSYALNPECNPWLEGGYTSLRVIILPVIDSLCNGSCSVTVTGFSLFWLDGYGGGKCTGSACEIAGRFINADLTMGGLLGAYDPNGSIHYARLVE